VGKLKQQVVTLTEQNSVMMKEVAEITQKKDKIE
jgi:hypothetical protein